jgi:thiol:disulfide interchange protein DsbD
MRYAAMLTMAAACTAASAARDPFARPDSPLGAQPGPAQALLTVDEAFRVLPPQRDGDRVRIEWDIAPGYFLYRNRLAVSAVAPANAPLGGLTLPEGKAYSDAHFGIVQIYRGDLVATIGDAARVTRVRVRYQGCADAGVCYPPQEKEFDIAEGSNP